MKRKKSKEAFTIIELLLGVVLVSAVMMIIGLGFIFFKKQIDIYAERQHIYSQIAYTLEDMKLRLISATWVDNDSVFNPPAFSGEPQVNTEMFFRGQKDIYNVTPDDLTDDIWYKYAVDQSTGDLVLYTYNSGKALQKQEVLVEGKYKPKLEFSYKKGYEPNFCVVTVTVPSGRANFIDIQNDIKKMEGLRIWFVDVVR